MRSINTSLSDYVITPNILLNFDNIEAMFHHHDIGLLQYRNDILNDELRYEQASFLQKICRKYQVPFIINNDIDLALRLDVDGVHLGWKDTSIVYAKKRLGDDKILGVSCYNDVKRAQIMQTLGVSYVAFGSMYPSLSKPQAPTCNIKVLQKICIKLPKIAIGGIEFNNKEFILSNGADMVAMISAYADYFK